MLHFKKKLGLMLFSLGAFTSAASAELKQGDAAPAFTLSAAQGGKQFTFDLNEALKNGPVVVYFYPKSFTKGCTLEAHTFADNIENFKAAHASLIGISADDINTQIEFSSKECRDKFPVAADPSLSVIKAYDAAVVRPSTGSTVAGRISYVITPDRKIVYVLTSSDAEKHVSSTLDAVKAWQGQHQN